MHTHTKGKTKNQTKLKEDANIPTQGNENQIFTSYPGKKLGYTPAHIGGCSDVIASPLKDGSPSVSILGFSICRSWTKRRQLPTYLQFNTLLIQQRRKNQKKTCSQQLANFEQMNNKRIPSPIVRVHQLC